MMHLPLIAAALLFSVGPVLAEAATRRVTFAPGATSTTLKGAVRGYGAARYAISGRRGQTMHMLFSPSNRFCYYTVKKIGEDGLAHDGTMDGNEYGANLTADGDYQIDVFMMRNAARRKESCRYALSIEITGAPGGASAGVSDAMMRDVCKAATAPMYGVEPRAVTVGARIGSGARGFWIDGAIDKGGEGRKSMRCLFKSDRTLERVMATTPDGE